MKGKLYGVGVGPGDPMLMTEKAVQVIKKCPVLAVPTRKREDSAAYRIASAAMDLEEKDCLGIYMPMTRDGKELEKWHERGASELMGVLNMGQDIAFLTLGDPTIYATYMYLHRKVAGVGYPTEIISGIPSFCAAAASLQISLAEQSEQLHIIPAGHKPENALALPGTKIFMKAGKKMGRLRELLKDSGHTACMVENCGMEGEKKYYSAEEIDENAGYYSLVIARETDRKKPRQDASEVRQDTSEEWQDISEVRQDASEVWQDTLEEWQDTPEAQRDIPEKRQIFLVGIGTGRLSGMTGEAREIVAECDLFIGAARMLEVLPEAEKRRVVEYRPREIGICLRERKDWKRACILLSGDVGFYSGAKGMMEELKDFSLRLIPGVSSVAAMCARLGMPWEDVKLYSVHGKGEETPIVARIREHRYTFWLLGGGKDLQRICQRLLEYGMDCVILHVGERLGYESERVVQGTVSQIAEQDFDTLLALVVENPHPTHWMGCEIPDDEWIRGQVPMTKSEVRSVIVSKLKLEDSSILYDVGAGTGSVAIQVALWHPEARICAVERNVEACRLIRENRKKFLTDNVKVFHGEAPDVLSELPAPSHAFIGGSGGRIGEIISYLIEKNRDCRIVISAVSLNTLSEVMQLIRNYDEMQVDIVQLSVSRGKEMGTSRMMIAQNPVYVITLCR